MLTNHRKGLPPCEQKSRTRGGDSRTRQTYHFPKSLTRVQEEVQSQADEEGHHPNG